MVRIACSLLLSLLAGSAPAATLHVPPAGEPVRLLVEGEALWAQGTLARGLWADPSAAYSAGVLPMMTNVDPEEVLSGPLPRPLRPGRYRLYARVWSDGTAGPGECTAEFWLGDRMRRLSWHNRAEPGKLFWSPPLDFTTRQAARRLEVRTAGSRVMRLAIDCFALTSDPAAGPPPDAVPTGGRFTPETWLARPVPAPAPIFQPAEAPEVGLKLVWEDGNPCQVLLHGQRPRLRLSYSAGDGRPREVTCTLKLEDYRGRATESRVQWRLSDGESRPLTVAPAGKGIFRLNAAFATTDGAAKGSRQVTFAVIWPARRIRPDETVIGGHFWAMAPELRRLGVSWVRLWDFSAATLWSAVEPEKGRWVWNDEGVDRLRREGFEILGMLESPPKWAPDRAREQGPWLEYVRRVVSRYRGKIRYWELLNEPYYMPGCSLETVKATAKYYYDLLVPTARVVKEANPDAQLVGPCGPPGEYPNVFDYWRELFDLGALRHLDILSAHMYVGGVVYPLDQDRAFEDYLVQLRKLLAERGRPDMPIWDTESGCGPNETFYTGKEFWYGLISGTHTAHAPVPYATQAAMVSRFAAIHAAQQVRWFYYALIGNYCFSQAAFEKNHAPLPFLVAYSNAAHFLAGAKPVERLDVAAKCPAYLFRTGPGALAVTWAEQLKRGETRILRWSPPKGAAAYDLMGNPLGRLEALGLGMEPVYLQAPDLPALAAALKAARVEVDVPPAAAARALGNANLAAASAPEPPQLVADSTAPGYSPAPVNDGVLAGTGEPRDSWRSGDGPAPHWLEVRWPRPVTFNKVVIGRPTAQATGYVAQVWRDGEWRNVPFTPDYRSSGLGTEPMWLPEYAVDRLRVLQDPKAGRPFALTEVAITLVPPATPAPPPAPDELARAYEPDEKGYLRDWLVCGPFPSPGGRWSKTPGWDRNYFADPWTGAPTEPTVRPQAGQRVLTTFADDEDAVWKPWEVYAVWRPAHSREPILDFTPYTQSELLGLTFGTPERVIAYAFAYVVSPVERQVTLSVGTDDGVRAWLNGAEIANRLIYRSVSLDTDSYPCTLKAGVNALLVKVNNDVGGHALVARFLDAAGQPVRDLAVRLSPP